MLGGAGGKSPGSPLAARLSDVVPSGFRVIPATERTRQPSRHRKAMRQNEPVRRTVLSALLLSIVWLLAVVPAALAVDPPTPPSPSEPGGESPFPSATPKAVVDVTGKVFPAVVRLDVAQEI